MRTFVISPVKHGFIVSPKRNRKAVPSIKFSGENVPPQISRGLAIELNYILNASVESCKSWILIAAQRVETGARYHG